MRSAIAYIKKWREDQNLPQLSPADEREAARTLIVKRGYDLPKDITVLNEKFHLKDGRYVVDSINLSIVPNKAPQEEAVVNEEPLIQSEEVSRFPWSPNDNREFWCEKLGFFVKLTRDVNIEGTYYVVKVGEGYYRRYPVFGNELVLKDKAPSNAPATDLLTINHATWGEIKNFLVDKFIPSYPWPKKGDLSPSEVREEMNAIAKSKHKGLAKMIENERSSFNGVFEGHENFTFRMTQVYESFPWSEFAQTLDYTQ